LRNAGRHFGAIMLILVLTAAVAGPAGAEPKHRGWSRHAQGPPPAEKREQARPAEIAISPSQAAGIAAAYTGGRVLDVQLQGGKRPRYRVRVLLGGERVRTVTVDAMTGEFRG
jgi:hypothetical protein